MNEKPSNIEENLLADKSAPTDWQLQIVGFIDGELNNAEIQSLMALAQKKPEIASELSEAIELQAMLAELPIQKAPTRLREKLAAIPDHEPSPSNRSANKPQTASPLFAGVNQGISQLSRYITGLPAIARFAIIPVAIIVGLQLLPISGGPTPLNEITREDIRPLSDTELAQAERDLATALTYLNKTSKRAGFEIQLALHNGIQQAVTNNTIRLLNSQLSLKKETLL